MCVQNFVESAWKETKREDQELREAPRKRKTEKGQRSSGKSEGKCPVEMNYV
jgi:hypothetical protein